MTQILKERIKAAFRSYRDEIVTTIIAKPQESYDAIARNYGVTASYVYRLARAYKVRRRIDQNSKVDHAD